MDRQLFSLLRGFYSLTSTNKLEFPKGLLPSDINEFLLFNILLDPHFQQYPPSKQYQKQFWKWAIANLEQMPIEDDDEEFEVDLQIYKHYFALLPPSGPAIGSSQPKTRDLTCGRGIALSTEPPTSSYVTHFWTTSLGVDTAERDSGLVDLKHYQRSTILESRTMIEGGTTGLRTWLASFVLAQYLINYPDIVSSSRVLELGSGTGFLGIVVATLQSIYAPLSNSSQQSALWLTDINDDVLARCRDNINLPCNSSSTSTNITYLDLDWADSIDPERSSTLNSVVQEINADIILGADVAFDPTIIPSLIGMLQVALQPRGSGKRALIAMAMRNPSTQQKFMDEASAIFQIEVLDVDLDRQVFWETMENTETAHNVKSFSITLL